MAGAACCSTPDCFLNGTGQQAPCVSSKGKVDLLYAKVNTLLESSKVGTRERSGIFARNTLLFFHTGFNNEWTIVAI